MTKRTRSPAGRLFRRPGRPGWYLRARFAGSEITRFAGHDRTTATAVLAETIRRLSRATLLGEKLVPAVALRDVLPELLGYLERRHASTTIASERSRLERLSRHLGPKPLRDVEAGDLVSFVSALQAGKLSGKHARPVTSRAAVNRHLAAASIAFRWAVERGFATGNPVREVRRTKEPMPAATIFSAADVARLVSHADPGFRPFLRVVADTGMRRGEALALTWQDVNLREGTLQVRRSKNGRPRSVPMTAEVRRTLEALRRGRVVPMRRADPVFGDLARLHPAGISRRFRRVGEDAGFGPARLHDLRHSAAVRMVRAGVSLPVVARILGHRSLVACLRYSRHVDEAATRAAIHALDEEGVRVASEGGVS